MIRRGIVGVAAVRRHGRDHRRAVAHRRPGSLVPDEDQGCFITAVILPDGATLAAHRRGGRRRWRRRSASNPANAGRDRLHRLRLPRRRLPQQRRDHLRHAEALGRAQGHDAAAGRRAVRRRPRGIKEALVLAFVPPPIFGLGTAGGFEFYLQNHGEGGAEADERGRAGSSCSTRRPRARSSAYAQTLWRANVPQLYVDVDREKAKKARRADRRHLRALSATLGNVLRQRLQQVRPHLAGADVGGARLPHAARRRRCASTCAPRRATWCRSPRSSPSSTRRARTRSTASTTCRR